MGKATDYLVKLIQQQVNEKGVVVWFAPDGTYAQLANTLMLANARLVRMSGSYLALRREADDLYGE